LRLLALQRIPKNFTQQNQINRSIVKFRKEVKGYFFPGGRAGLLYTCRLVST
jgi:hypothetical protein